MQLEKLEVFRDEILIREIKFKDGINIITNSEEDGNQIGKSTALRVINFCLGSDGKSIWHDPESRTKNEAIEEIVTSGRVLFSLHMRRNKDKYIIKRRISKVEQKTRTVLKIYSSINSDEFTSNNKFKESLAPILGLSTSNPTYSSIKNRFVRLDKKTASNTYRYLNVNTSDRDYILYYSYLFGFSGHDDLASEIQFGEEIERRESRISMLLNGRKEQDYKDKLKSIDDEIEFLKDKEDLYDFKESQNTGVDSLRNIREKIANLTSEITKLNIRISYSEKSINGYEEKRSNINTDLIEKIYIEAKSMLPDLKKTLEETIDFHEQVISKKINYLKEKIQEYKTSINIIQDKLNKLLDDEKTLLKALIGESHLSGFILIEKQIQDKREERGRIKVIIDEIGIESREISDLSIQIGRLREKNKQQLSQLIQNVEIFNTHLKSFSRAIFKDFSLSFNASTKSDSNEIEFSIVNQKRVSGDGAPRAAALAFDMAFIEFVKETGSSFPKFTIQDYLEASDQEKLASLFQIANTKKVQVVASVLKDKLASLSQNFIESNTVLTLKKSDKFFKIN